MQSDTYTKTVLTIIAAAVVLIALKDTPILSTANAQNSNADLSDYIQRLQKASASNALNVNIVAIAGNDLPTKGEPISLPVEVVNK